MDAEADAFETVRGGARIEMKVRDSRFIAVVHHVRKRDEVEVVLNALRGEFHDATHHCYAYRLGSSGEQHRAHDDGEPAGSAGKPILHAIDREGLRNVLVVVIRYFGGTKLGVGGLHRAYGGAAARALASAQRETTYVMEQMTISFAHDQMGGVMHAIAKTGARTVETTYHDQVVMRLEVRASRAGQLRGALADRTGGRVTFIP
ncbi:MAG: YigZ family protein [Bacteroidota bacterium]